MKGDRFATGAVVVVLGLSAVLLALAAAPAGADHGSPGDWSMEPADPPQDAQPGYETASWIHWAEGGDDFRGDGLEEVHHIEMVSEDFSFADCTLFDVDEFGIDRGGDNEGTETDDNLATHVKDYEFAEDRMWMAMYRSEDAGGQPVHLNASDQFVAHQTNCYTNPDEAGWYQLEGWANGTAWDGDFDEARLFTHYIYVCDCEDRDEAREELGPPPSEEAEDEDEPEETESSGNDDGDADGGEDDGASEDGGEDSDGGDADNEAGDDGGEDDGASEDGGEDDGAADDDGEDDGAADDGEVNDSEADDDGQADGEDDADEPVEEDDATDEDGPGFGALAALVALLASALLVRRT